MNSIEIPIVPYLDNQQKSWCFLWCIAQRYNIERSNGSGKIDLKKFRLWLKQHKWTNPSRTCDYLLTSPFAKQSKTGVFAFLVSRKVLIHFCVNMNIKYFPAGKKVRIFTGLAIIHDKFKSSDFTRWYVQAIAALPQYRPQIIKSTKGNSYPYHYGKSVEKLAKLAGVSKRWFIKKTIDTRVQNFESVVMPTDPHQKANVEIEIADKREALKHAEGNNYLFQCTNTYRANTFFKRCILLHISHSGQSLLVKEYKAKIGGNLFVEKSKEKKKNHPPSPDTKKLFNMK